jgi:hypothetical protein
MTTFEHLRILPISDTQEIFEEIGDKWTHPGDTRRHRSQRVDWHFLQWIAFCEEAKKGYCTGVEDPRDIDAYLAFSASLKGETVKYPDIITKIESAFALLLSNEGAKILEKHNIHPKEVVVDDILKGQVMQLISRMEDITEAAIDIQERESLRMFPD